MRRSGNMRLRVASITETGLVRKNNEDRLLVCADIAGPGVKETDGVIEPGPGGALFAVADGMGGTVAGEVAAMLAVDALAEMFEARVLKPGDSDEEVGRLIDLAFLSAWSRMLGRGGEDPGTLGMGTTLVMGWIRDGRMHLAWIGDSRCYLYGKGGGLTCLTRDHSFVQSLVDEELITPEEAFDHPHSNVISRCLLCEEDNDPTPDHIDCDLEAGDRLFFCSDGLNGMLRDREIGEVLSSEEGTRSCVERLVGEAIANGGKDNVTVILVDVEAVGR